MSFQVRWNGYAGKIIINGTDYKLLQCHWHSPSEHTLNGSRFVDKFAFFFPFYFGMNNIIFFNYFQYDHLNMFVFFFFFFIELIGRYDLELHIIHLNSKAEIAVTAIVYKYGQPDPFLTMVLPWFKVQDSKRQALL